LLGWDVENGFILGVSITVELAEHQEQHHHQEEDESPPNLSADGKMNELLELMERGDQCQLPALGKPTMTIVQVPSNGFKQSHANPRWLPVTYSKVESVAASLSLFCERSNLNLKVKLISFGNLSMIGDETGAVCMKVHCRTMFRLLKKLKVGASIIIRKATVRVRRGLGQHECIHVDVDKDVGSIEESGYPFQFEPYQDNNISAQGELKYREISCIKPAKVFCGEKTAEVAGPQSLLRAAIMAQNEFFSAENEDPCCGDAVQVAFDMHSDSKDPVALTLGTKGVIAEINQHGDVLLWFPGEEKHELVKTHAFSNLIFVKDGCGHTIRFDVSSLRDREIRRPGWFLEDVHLTELIPGRFVCCLCWKNPCKEGCVAGGRKGK